MRNALVLLVSIFLLPSLSQATPISPERQKELLHLLKQDCGSCHGMTLKGGLGPDLHPERLNRLPRQFLLDAILLGRPGTPMPPWNTMLSAAEAEWLLNQLLLGSHYEK